MNQKLFKRNLFKYIMMKREEVISKMAKKKIKTFKNGEDFEWFSENFSKRRMNEHSGKWIAIKDKKILSSGANVKIVISEARKKVDEPILVKIPKKEEVLIL